MDTKLESGEHQSAPFQNKVDVTLFYEQCSRRPMLNEIKKAVLESVSVLTLFGEEGSGKTMLCKMIESELTSRYQVVLYESAVMSFEDVIRPAAAKTDIVIQDQVTRKELNNLLPEILTRLQLKGERLLLIFDEADKIFLATLERIRKMLDTLNADGQYLQVLFSGEPALQSNLDQLALCEFQGATEQTFSLGPLDEEETFGYLKSQMSHFNLEDDPFTRERSGQVFSLAQGNFAKTNIEAAKLVSFPVSEQPASLADNEGLKSPPTKAQKKSKKKPALSGWWTRSEFISIAGICGLVIVIAVVLLGRKEPSKDTDGKKEITQSVKIKQEVVQQKAEEPKKSDQERSKKDITKKRVQTVKKKEIKAHPEIEAPPEKEVAIDKKIEKEKTDKKEKAALDTVVVEKNEEDDTVAEPVQPRLRSGKIETQPFIVISSASSRYMDSDEGSSQPFTTEQQRQGVDQLYDRRVRAASKWSRFGTKGRYTVQLMVLTAEEARENVKKELAKQEFQEIEEKLYIMQSAGSPPSVYVFYGDYPSKAAARKVRNNLPLFLRKHDPYVTSIEEALNKAGRKSSR